MRLTSFGIVFVLVASFLAGRASAQIPERALFQPGSYAYGYAQRQPSAGLMMQTVLVEVPAVETAAVPEGAEAADGEAPDAEAREENGPVALAEVQVPVPVREISVPYLAYHRHPVTHRIHVVPYQHGYAAAPCEFPQHQSRLNLWLSSLPCRAQDRPQVWYAGYYDPDPVIIQDKPSRVQLILGYPNGAWTSCCDNRWGDRLAQCPGIMPVAVGPPAEAGIKDQLALAHRPAPGYLPAPGYGHGHAHAQHGHGHAHGHAHHGHAHHGHGGDGQFKKCDNPNCPRCSRLPAAPEKQSEQEK